MTVNLHPRVRFSSQDARVFSDVMRSATLQLGAEHFTHDTYLDSVIEKPWGHEYRVFCNCFYDVWKLYLQSGQATSMHCHPRKETALLCLQGTAKVQFIGTSHIVRAQDVVCIGKGVWHATTNIGSDALELVEVECPRNKLDLVRVEDRYGRAGTQYEHSTLEADCPIYSDGLIIGSKLRHHCVQHRYRFQVLTGQQLAEAPATPFLFLVSLSFQDAIQHQIRVYSATPPPDVFESDTPYLLITQEKEILQ